LLPNGQVLVAGGLGTFSDGYLTSAELYDSRSGTFSFAGNMTMAAILVVSSGLVARSLMGLLAVDIGFKSEGVLTARLSVAGAQFSAQDNALDIRNTVQFYDGLLEKVRALPGVESAAAVTTLPLGGDIDGYGLHVVGRPEANPESAPSADRFVVTPGFFDTMGIRLLRGRLLDASDRQGAPSSVVVAAQRARGS
jgi:hypothetical protein